MGEQQTLKPAIEQLQKPFNKLGTPDTFKQAQFTADSGFHSEVNLEYMATKLAWMLIWQIPHFEVATHYFKKVKPITQSKKNVD